MSETNVMTKKLKKLIDAVEFLKSPFCFDAIYGKLFEQDDQGIIDSQFFISELEHFSIKISLIAHRLPARNATQSASFLKSLFV